MNENNENQQEPENNIPGEKNANGEEQPSAESEEFSTRLDLSGIRQSADDLRNEAAKILVGMDDVIDLILIAVFCEGHILLEGVPGIAKTLTAKITAHLIDVDYNRLQFTPDLMPSDVLGTSVFNPKTAEFEFRRGPVFTNVLLVDEINRAPAKTQSALFEVMEERQATIDGIRHEMSYPFLVLATQNPIEFEGTYRLPEAQIDRFIFKILLEYPSQEAENEILKLKHERRDHLDLSQLDKILDKDKIREYKELIQQVYFEDHLFKYVTDIVRLTRDHPDIFMGASPRASISMLFASKAFAALQGRDFVKPEDIQFIARPVLRHRIILSSEKEMEGASTDDVINNIIQAVEVPR